MLSDFGILLVQAWERGIAVLSLLRGGKMLCVFQMLFSGRRFGGKMMSIFGFWKFSAEKEVYWKDLQNLSQDKRMLSDYLLNEYRQAVEERYED